MAYHGRRMRHVCSTKGCSNRDVILYAKNREVGGGLYLCKTCIENLQKFLPLFGEGKKADEKKETTEKAVEGVAEEKAVEGVADGAEEAPKKVSRKKSMTVPKDGE